MTTLASLSLLVACSQRTQQVQQPVAQSQTQQTQQSQATASSSTENSNQAATSSSQNAPEAQPTNIDGTYTCLLYTSPSPRDGLLSRMPSSA